MARTLFGSIRSGGDYASWADAVAACSGYSAPEILERVKSSALLVKNGGAAYEQNGQVFAERSYEWPVLACLLRVARAQGLHVLDFGGSLGSHYYRHRSFLSDLSRFHWSVVEQPGFVKVGQELFQDEQLRFFSDVQSCIAWSRPDVCLLSCVIHYLPAPYEFLADLITHDLPFLLFDRVPFANSDRDRLCVQRVGKPNYPGSYPAWLLSRSRFLSVVQGRYRLLEDFDNPEGMNLPGKCRGMLFVRSERP